MEKITGQIKLSKEQLVRGFLLSIIILMVFLIFFISFKLRDNGNKTVSLAPRKIKAVNKTYSRLIVLKPTEVEGPVNSPTPILEEPTPTSPVNGLTPLITNKNETAIESSPTVEVGETITPTEIIVAYVKPTIEEKISTKEGETSISPTPVKNLPEAGTVGYPILIFGLATLVIFFSFLF